MCTVYANRRVSGIQIDLQPVKKLSRGLNPHKRQAVGALQCARRHFCQKNKNICDLNV